MFYFKNYKNVYQIIIMYCIHCRQYTESLSQFNLTPLSSTMIKQKWKMTFLLYSRICSDKSFLKSKLIHLSDSEYQSSNYKPNGDLKCSQYGVSSESGLIYTPRVDWIQSYRTNFLALNFLGIILKTLGDISDLLIYCTELIITNFMWTNHATYPSTMGYHSRNGTNSGHYIF